MKRQQCLDRGQGRVILIYTPLIGNSRVLHLNRILGPVASTRPGGRGRAMRALGGWRDGLEVRVSVKGSIVVSIPAARTEVLWCVRACVQIWKRKMPVSEQN